MDNPLLYKQGGRWDPHLVEENLCPIILAIEREACSGRPAVLYRPHNFQVPELIETNTVIIKNCASRLSLLRKGSYVLCCWGKKRKHDRDTLSLCCWAWDTAKILRA